MRADRHWTVKYLTEDVGIFIGSCHDILAKIYALLDGQTTEEESIGRLPTIL